MTPAEKYEHFLQKVGQSFSQTPRGCSIPKLVDFYENYVVTNGVVTSIVNDHRLRFNACDLGELIVVPSEDFNVYVHEDKSILGDEHLLELTQRLPQNPHLTEPPSMRKGK